MKKIHFLLFVSICFQSVIAQKEGFWDKDRAITKEIKVSARDRIVIKTDDLPTGTTELIYRITLLDENQQLAGSLTSILKSIPDPTGISQGSAGAIFIMSKISGDDKCKYAIFNNKEAAAEYQKSGKTTDACLVQDTPLSKDAKRISVDKSTCFKSNSGTLWFGFESTNWIMKQKIILEIVPWVDSKLSRGWTVENRKFIIDQCKTSALARKMTSSDDFCICIEEKIQKDYRFDEFQKLLTIEQAKIYKDNGTACYSETTVSKNVYADLRNTAATAFKNNEYALAIKNYATIINDKQGSVLDYANLGYCYLITKQYGKAIKYLKEGEQKDPSELFIKLNLAHAYLLDDNYSEAKSIYKEYQTQNLTARLSWTQKVKDDFEVFQKLGLPSGDFDRVLRLFK